MYDGQVYVRIVQNRDLVSLEFNIKAKFIGNSQEVDFDIEIGTEGMSEILHAPILLIMLHDSCTECIFTILLKFFSHVQLFSMVNFIYLADSVNQSK